MEYIPLKGKISCGCVSALSTTPKMSQFPYSSEPRSFGGSSYHSMSPLQSSSFTGYSTTRLHHDATQTIWSAETPNIGNLTACAPTICSVSQANTPEVYIAEPETSPLSANVSTLPLRDHEIWDQILHHRQEGVEQPEIWVILGRISGIQRASQRISSWLGEVEVCSHILYFIVLIQRLVWIIKPI